MAHTTRLTVVALDAAVAILSWVALSAWRRCAFALVLLGIIVWWPVSPPVAFWLGIIYGALVIGFAVAFGCSEDTDA